MINHNFNNLYISSFFYIFSTTIKIFIKFIKKMKSFIVILFIVLISGKELIETNKININLKDKGHLNYKELTNFLLKFLINVIEAEFSGLKQLFDSSNIDTILTNLKKVYESTELLLKQHNLEKLISSENNIYNQVNTFRIQTYELQKYFAKKLPEKFIELLKNGISYLKKINEKRFILNIFKEIKNMKDIVSDQEKYDKYLNEYSYFIKEKLPLIIDDNFGKIYEKKILNFLKEISDFFESHLTQIMQLISLTHPIFQSKIKNKSNLDNLIKNINKFYTFQKKIASKNDFDGIIKFLDNLYKFFQTYNLRATQYYYLVLSIGIQILYLREELIKHPIFLNELYYYITQYSVRILINDFKNSINLIKKFIKKYEIETFNFPEKLKEIRRLIATAKEENIKKLLKGAFDFVKMIVNS